MKKLNKLFVVLPLVLVFVINSLPVFAWHSAKPETEITFTFKNGDNKVGQAIIKAGEFTEARFGDSGIAKASAINEFLLDEMMPLTKDVKLAKEEGRVILDPSAGELNTFYAAVADDKTTFDGTNGKNAYTVAIKIKAAEAKVNTRIPIMAWDVIAQRPVITLIRELENFDWVNSLKDRVDEYVKYEQGISETLADYYFLDFYAAHDVFGMPNYNQGYEAILNKYNSRIMVVVAKKMQPMNVYHIFPDRAHLYEEIFVDYFVKFGNNPNTVVSNWNAADLASTRIQKMNELGYIFDHAEYRDAEYIRTHIKDAVDMWGHPVPLFDKLKDAGIFIYYKGAPALADNANKVDAVKKVDAANVQANVAPANNTPVTAASEQLPATGAANNAFMFLSSAALMALGIFFFKKR